MSYPLSHTHHSRPKTYVRSSWPQNTFVCIVSVSSWVTSFLARLCEFALRWPPTRLARAPRTRRLPTPTLRGATHCPFQRGLEHIIHEVRRCLRCITTETRKDHSDPVRQVCLARFSLLRDCKYRLMCIRKAQRCLRPTYLPHPDSARMEHDL